ncbi:MAG: homocysteine S-methyltransferase family protein [Candidatus Aminicenantes bacterium]|nr:homocysteine S-methyltransferase family protein [Candidatus Aminicenantes bacterium]
MVDTILELIEKKTVVLDGGMGTELMKHGFSSGECPEKWNIEKPDVIKSIHQSYFDAGSDVVLTNSFGGSKLKLTSYGLDEQCYELNRQAGLLANAVKPERKFVAGSMGPTGKFLWPQGDYTEGEFEDAYGVQAKGLSDGQVDFILIETQYDIKETLCALKAARKNASCPVFVTMTFEKYPRGFFTMMGSSISQCIESLEEENVPVIGANCTLDSADMAELIKSMRATTSLPLIAQANAGKATLTSEGEVFYSQGIDNYVKYVSQIIDNGAGIIGGCCGTDPDYIRRITQILASKPS